MSENAHIVQMTEPAIMSFPHLFDPKAFTRNGKAAGEPKYSANIEMAKGCADLLAIRDEAIRVAKERFSGRNLKELKFPWVSGALLADKAAQRKKDREWSRDLVVIAARSKYAPALAVMQGGKIIDLTTDALRAMHKGKFYSGVEVLAQFNLVAYEGGNGPDGVTAYLNLVLSLNRGTRLAGGSPSAAEVFKSYAGTVSAEDPTSNSDPLFGADDDIPF